MKEKEEGEERRESTVDQDAESRGVGGRMVRRREGVGRVCSGAVAVRVYDVDAMGVVVVGMEVESRKSGRKGERRGIFDLIQVEKEV